MSEKYESPNYCSGFVWGLDFCRAINERSWFWKLLFRIAVGKYAYSEFKGLWDETKKQGYGPDLDYGLEEMDYHTTDKSKGPNWAVQF